MKDQWQGKNFSFFTNKACEYYPCHADVPPEEFNCLFCYCPLYALGDRCGGDFRYTARGIKDCSACVLPHKKENYGKITEKCRDLAELVNKKHGEN